MRDLPNPFNFGQPEPSRFVLDEAAFMDALEPLSAFLDAPRADPDHELDQISRPDRWPSLSAVLRELSELAHSQDRGGHRP